MFKLLASNLLFDADQSFTLLYFRAGARLGLFNGILIAVKMAQMAVELKALTGQGVSRTGDYVKAPDHVIEEFLSLPKRL